MRIILVSMNEIGGYALEVLAKKAGLAALFTIKERGKHYMDMYDYTDLAKKYNIPLYRIDNINDPEANEQMRALEPDYCFSLGWKQVINEQTIAIPKRGWIGGHPAYLLFKGEKADPAVLSAPGNEPLNYAILGEYKKTGMSMIWVKAKIDAGEIFARREIPLDVEHETSYTLLQKMARATGEMMEEHIASVLAGNPPRIPQEFHAMQPYMKPLKPDKNRIDLSAPAEDTYRLIRSCIYPYPNAFIEFHGQRIYVESARMENGVFTELKVRAGGTPWGAARFTVFGGDRPREHREPSARGPDDRGLPDHLR